MTNFPLTMTARSAKAIDHWFWGRVVHDLGGMFHKSKIPVDYCHEEEIGFLDKFGASKDGLVVSGAIVPTGVNSDPSDKIIARLKGGVPYEASINFAGDGTVIEVVSEGATVEVNGFTFLGPGLVFREWPLRGVAICPYGADMNTETSFKQGSSMATTEADPRYCSQSTKEQIEQREKHVTKFSELPYQTAAREGRLPPGFALMNSREYQASLAKARASKGEGSSFSEALNRKPEPEKPKQEKTSFTESLFSKRKK